MSTPAIEIAAIQTKSTCADYRAEHQNLACLRRLCLCSPEFIRRASSDSCKMSNVYATVSVLKLYIALELREAKLILPKYLPTHEDEDLQLLTAVLTVAVLITALLSQSSMAVAIVSEGGSLCTGLASIDAGMVGGVLAS
jgi:hypothetical protein